MPQLREPEAACPSAKGVDAACQFGNENMCLITGKGLSPLSVGTLARYMLAAQVLLEASLQHLTGLFLLQELVFSSCHDTRCGKDRACVCLDAACMFASALIISRVCL